MEFLVEFIRKSGISFKKLLRKSGDEIVRRFFRVPALLKKYAVPLTGLALLVILPLLIRSVVWLVPVNKPVTVQPDDQELGLIRYKINHKIAALDRKLDARKPRSYYLVINSASNEFFLYRGGELIKRDKCSTGSFVLLKNGEEQQWMFKTPKGEFRIQYKTTSPVWKKPDWAFVEEGLPVPPANHHSRFEYSVLGDYALSIGDGYLIHGTLYQRFLGLPVTHGCIRLNDENLELVYKSLQVGSKVYIY
jgi:L,D-transpeptidase YbiS